MEPIRPAAASRRAMRPSSMREANCDLVLQTLERVGPKTRAELAQLTSLTPQALGSIMSVLMDEQMVRCDEAEAVGRGRPSGVYAVDPGAGYWLGASVQWRSVLLALGDASGTIVERGRIEHIGTSMAEILEETIAEARRMLDRVPGAEERLRAVGLSVQGMVDPSQGRVIESECWPERDVSPAEFVEARTGWITRIDSAARATARAEVERTGAAEGLVAVLYVSHDPALVMVHDGVVLEGANGLGGALAHLPVPGADAPCECGRRGCMTTTASGSAVVDHFNQRTGRNVTRAPEVVDAARAGDPTAKAALDEYRRTTAEMTAMLLSYIHPDLLVLSGLVGGPDSHGAQGFVELVRERLSTAQADDLEIVISPYAQDAHVRGALLLARQARRLREMAEPTSALSTT